ncbi:MAG: hypothetical protein HC942_14840, partial [Microcoleus sp. SU_5_6]|nr:hypothetical protein [Microcoleus sp. SU_5_6]
QPTTKNHPILIPLPKFFTFIHPHEGRKKEEEEGRRKRERVRKINNS